MEWGRWLSDLGRFYLQDRATYYQGCGCRVHEGQWSNSLTWFYFQVNLEESELMSLKRTDARSSPELQLSCIQLHARIWLCTVKIASKSLKGSQNRLKPLLSELRMWPQLNGPSRSPKERNQTHKPLTHWNYREEARASHVRCDSLALLSLIASQKWIEERRKAHIKRMHISCSPYQSSWRKLWDSISVWNVATSLWILIGWGPTLRREYVKENPISASVGAVSSDLLMNQTDHINDTSRRDVGGSQKRRQLLLSWTSSTTIFSWWGGWKWKLKLQKMSCCIKDVDLRQKSVPWRKRTRVCSVKLRTSSNVLIKLWSVNEVSVSSSDWRDMTFRLRTPCVACWTSQPIRIFSQSSFINIFFSNVSGADCAEGTDWLACSTSNTRNSRQHN